MAGRVSGGQYPQVLLLVLAQMIHVEVAEALGKPHLTDGQLCPPAYRDRRRKHASVAKTKQAEKRRLRSLAAMITTNQLSVLGTER